MQDLTPGRRLSDRIREAVRAEEFDAAGRLALQGDGQARSLEKEYALMVKGLGITIRILLDQVAETLGRAQGPARERADGTLAGLLEGFGRDVAAVAGRAWGPPAAGAFPPAPPGRRGAAEALADARRTLDAAERLFGAEQSARAREALGAITARDGARALAALDRKERGEYVPLHDRLILLMAQLFGWVLLEFGPEALLGFHRETAERQRGGFEKWERLDPAEFARATVFLLKQHMGEVEITEDAEKITLVQRPCGSGGRLRLAGAYAGPGALPLVESGGPLAAGQDRFPVYCSHCPVWNTVAPVEWFGRAQWVFDEPSRADGSCTLHIYKNRDAVPRAYYERLGLVSSRP